MPNPPPWDEQIQALIREQFLTDREMSQFWDERQRRGDPIAPTRVLEELAGVGLLTSFQVRMVRANKTDQLKIGKYRLREVLGRGGFGCVYKAHNTTIRRDLAIKVLRVGAVDADEAVERFRREMEAAASLSHDHIVPAVDFGGEGEDLYFVLEYLPGGDLDRLVQGSGALSVIAACRAILDAARGLAHAHKQRVVHRDVKPQNLLLTADSRVKVGDLGLAKFLDQSLHLTQTNAALGSPPYMAPEQCESTARVEAAADVYSLGCTLFFLLKGRPPYGDRLPAGHMYAHKHEPIPPLGIAPRLDALHREMMAKAPGDRPASMNDVVRELELVIREIELPSRPLIEIVTGRIEPVTPADTVDIVVPAARRVLSPSTGMPFVRVEPGEFWMGSHEGVGYEHEREPRHLVRISRPFQLGVTPVTEGEYRKLIPGPISGSEHHPIVEVSWFDAVKYCNVMSEAEGRELYYAISPDGETVGVPNRLGVGYRLPTEAEWEYACRAGSEGRWCFGDDESQLGEFAWYSENSGSQLKPVGGKSANAWGLKDMHGLVWEWCWDPFDGYPRGDPNVALEDPTGPAEGAAIRVVRGGSWFSGARNCRSASRIAYRPANEDGDLGFRLAAVWS